MNMWFCREFSQRPREYIRRRFSASNQKRFDVSQHFMISQRKSLRVCIIARTNKRMDQSPFDFASVFCVYIPSHVFTFLEPEGGNAVSVNLFLSLWQSMRGLHFEFDVLQVSQRACLKQKHTHANTRSKLT